MNGCVEGNVATIGITDYAQSSLGSIVYLESSEVDETVTQNETFGTVESVRQHLTLSHQLVDK